MSSPKPVAGIAALAVVAAVAMASGPSLGEAGASDGSQALTLARDVAIARIRLEAGASDGSQALTRLDRERQVGAAESDLVERVAGWLRACDIDWKRLVSVLHSPIDAQAERPALPR